MRLAFHALAAPDIDLQIAQVERPGPLDRVADVVAVAPDPTRTRSPYS